jgi:hypothetical protein
VLGEIGDLHRRADFQTAARRRRDGRVERRLDVDDAVRLRDVVFQTREQVLAAGQRHDLVGVRAERADGFLLGPRIDV